MDYSDFDEAELARRKKDQIEYRNKKRNSSILTFCSSLYEIVVSLVIFFVLFLLAAVIVSKTGLQDASNLLFYVMIALLIVSIILGFFIYKVTVRAIIKKYHLEDKILDSVLYHYKTKKEIKAERDSGLKL